MDGIAPARQDEPAPPPIPAGNGAGPLSLVGADMAGIGEAVRALGEPAFRAKQLRHWIYHRGARSFEEMTSISRAARAKLAERYTLDRPVPAEAQVSADGTRKWLLRFPDAAEAEMVFIPEEDRGTLCISSQVGCTLNCRFCHTGTQPWVRNLGAGEIVGQLMLARDALDDWPSARLDRRITNVVLMGMGEPLYNYDNVARAVRIMIDGDGIAISRRKLTLSTAGVVPVMRQCGEELGVNLAVSLHAVTDAIRDEIVPLNRRWPIAELLDACRTYGGVNNARRITFEYVMLRGVNDSDADARELVRLLKDIPAKINLIPFNPWPGAPYECSSQNRIRAFMTICLDGGLTCTVRTPRGRDIMAACGQLKSASERKRAGARV
ncbi:MAG: 23S rRNA (adenine(2503)-C(2))-methyltransferase RlmN [Rhodospirillaceae bacterium]|nr:23S rRNA (adenine(2503)-C(2))-methyltransferase RlmN [Rhodospirillaceae bacterium]MYB13941.1 23S rRNA (adenine(2503)-C(2))-methyltransferase RlmN [Rhodospirillaceae bacterium]MYI50000.1 23S rRNA (adenine(2503)-C(2))-methyltransferase RlmN [Rhodospirillaceae bacterium]